MYVYCASYSQSFPDYFHAHLKMYCMLMCGVSLLFNYKAIAWGNKQLQCSGVLFNDIMEVFM